MNKICTTINQSQKLIELGIDRTTADMYYSFDYNIEEYEDDAQIIPQSELGQHFSLFPEDIPAWSLAALLELMPKELEDDLELYYGAFGSDGEYHPLWVCTCMNYVLFGNTSVDAVFKVLCWLKENGKI